VAGGSRKIEEARVSGFREGFYRRRAMHGGRPIKGIIDVASLDAHPYEGRRRQEEALVRYGLAGPKGRRRFGSYCQKNL
jgi:hypothetical protein